MEDSGSLACGRATAFVINAHDNNRARSFECCVAYYSPMFFRVVFDAMEELFVGSCVGNR